MKRHLKTLIAAVAVALASAGVAFAEGDGGGDNSMSRWTGESYKAFDEARKDSAGLPPAQPSEAAGAGSPAACDNGMSRWCGDSFAAFRRSLVGDFYSDRDELARDTGRPQQIAAAPSPSWQVGRTFRDDTAG